MNKLSQFIIASAKHDKKNIKAIKTTDRLLLPDAFGQVDLSNLQPIHDDNGTNDNSGNNNDDTHDTGGGTIPDSGLNIDPGTSLSGVEQLWAGTTNVQAETEINLSKEISATGDGIQFVVQMLKTPIANGQSGSASTLPAVASNEAKPQTGKYVCSVPIPISILAKNLTVGKTINVVLDGIGEGLATTKVSQAPVISIYVKGTKTLTITNHQGYALDQKSGSNNGAFYDGQITGANSFTKEKPVTTLPNGSILFSGSAKDGEIKLAGVTDSWSNIADGILIYFSNITITADASMHTDFPKLYAKLSDCVQFNSPLLISKNSLKKGNSIGLPSKKVPIGSVSLYYESDGKKLGSATMEGATDGLINLNSNSFKFKSGVYGFNSYGNIYGMGGTYCTFTIEKVVAYTK